MTQPTPDLHRRLLFILHRGMVEARNLSAAGRCEQVSDLTDALELLPGLMLRWDDRAMESVQFALKTYEDKYPAGRYDYTPYLDRYPVPESF